MGLGLRAYLSVTDANRADLTATLGDLGVGAATMSPGDTASALTDLFDIARTDGEITAQAMDVSSANLVSGALGIKAPAVGGIALNTDSGTTSRSSEAAWYLGDHGWNSWEACS